MARDAKGKRSGDALGRTRINWHYQKPLIANALMTKKLYSCYGMLLILGLYMVLGLRLLVVVILAPSFMP